MNGSLLLLIGSFFYLIMIVILYFRKKRISTIENKIYKYILLVSIFGVIMDITGIYVHTNLPDDSLIRYFVLHFYHSYLLVFLYLFSLYMMMLKYNKMNNKNKNKIYIITIIFIVCLIINFLTPVSYYKEGNIIYAYGPNLIFLYFVAGISILCWTFYILKNFKTIKKKQHTPIIIFILLSIPVVILQMKIPSLLLVTSLISYVIVFMYHTIENPDVKMIEQLNIAKAQAEKANQSKTEFLSNMSHEIRTPLNAIVGFSQSLLEENLTESQKEQLSDIINASDSLLDIVNGILDISKIEANKLEIVNTEYNIYDVLHNLVALTKARLGEKPLDVRINFDPNIPPILYGDYSRLKQIILNLLTNAIKYTKEGYIEFKVSTIQKDNICRLIISVEDSGIGIKEENIDKLFSKFERFDLEKNITIEGTGLGLAITKKLVELMNGQIVVQSVYGKGSRFTVAIDQRIVDKQIEIKKQKTTDEIIDLTGKRILIVDDNKLNLKVASKLLEKYKCEVITCESGFECIEKINKGEYYDLILMDDMMPKMSGTETLIKLKQLPNFNIKVIALTANAIAGMKEKYIKIGFDDYLSKPIEKQELNKVLQNL